MHVGSLDYSQIEFCSTTIVSPSSQSTSSSAIALALFFESLGSFDIVKAAACGLEEAVEVRLRFRLLGAVSSTTVDSG